MENNIHVQSLRIFRIIRKIEDVSTLFWTLSPFRNSRSCSDTYLFPRSVTEWFLIANFNFKFHQQFRYCHQSSVRWSHSVQCSTVPPSVLFCSISFFHKYEILFCFLKVTIETANNFVYFLAHERSFILPFVYFKITFARQTVYHNNI